MAGQPQAIVTPLTESAIFLVLTVDPGGEDDVRQLLGSVNALRRSVGFRIPEGELTCIVGIGAELWERLFDGRRPAELHPFPGFAGAVHTAPSTPGDLLFHLRAHRADLCFELASRLIDPLRSVARVVDEVHGFRSFDERDLLGFVDGTENPENEAAAAAALIGDEDPQFSGGSYVIVQKYVHDMPGWDSLTTEEQELVIGRTKLSDLELPDETTPTNAHRILNTIVDDDGAERQILRLNMPFGHVGAGEFGTYFIGYARTPAVTEQMLTNMFIGKPAGNHDRILDFSTAVTGCLFYVPTSDFLDDPPPREASSMTATTTPDASLGLGSLREATR